MVQMTSKNLRCLPHPTSAATIDWCRLWSKEGPWKQIRSYPLWTKRERQAGEDDCLPRMAIAFKTELFPLVGIPLQAPKRLAQLLVHYGLAEQDRRSKGQRFLRAADDLVDELLASPDGDEGDAYEGDKRG